VIILPLCAFATGLIYPELKPAISFLAVVLVLLDVAWIDRQYRKSLRLAARASELFDVELLHLQWNALSAGKRPSPEDTDRAARNWAKHFGDARLRDWYSPAVDRAPMGLARAICQRTNLSYDTDLRNLYIVGLTFFAVMIVAVVIAIGFRSSSKVSEFVIAGWVPAAPFAIWALRERFRQTDAVEANAPILAEAENLIERVITGGCNEDECASVSRQLQNAIFNRRATTVLLFPGIYRFRRPDAERDMHASAEYWLERAGL
jgi:hypothetical protein